MRKEQAAQTGAELKLAAVRAFGRLGYLNTKITDITAEAGRAAGSFYTHYANKEALLEALLADLLKIGDESAAAAGHSDDFRDRSAVRWHVAVYWDFYRRHRTVMVALEQAATVDASFARRMREMVEPDVQHIADHLAKLALPDPLTVARMITTLLHGFIATWEGGDEVVDTLTDFIHAAIAGKN
ncbi:TetR/AcrR family transcriptional regulator [Actinoplanes sp. NPDC051470]|uniref:TetR/AcrR family transcriptional regulator n=1 Tax=unclassified Actinoplanes TaxID=2626549 RepID=UPI00342F35C7